MVKEGYEYYDDARFFYDIDDFESCIAIAEDDWYWKFGSREDFEYKVGVLYKVSENVNFDNINEVIFADIVTKLKLGFAINDGEYVKVRIKNDTDNNYTVYVFNIGDKNLIDIHDNFVLCAELDNGSNLIVEDNKIYKKINDSNE